MKKFKLFALVCACLGATVLAGCNSAKAGELDPPENPGPQTPYPPTGTDELDQQITDEIKDSLSLGIEEIKPDDARTLTLATSDSRGATISWASSDTSVISITGATATAAIPEEDAEVDITAVITLNNAISVKTFEITVKGSSSQEEPEPESPTPNTPVEVIQMFSDTYAALRTSGFLAIDPIELSKAEATELVGRLPNSNGSVIIKWFNVDNLPNAGEHKICAQFSYGTYVSSGRYLNLNIVQSS